MSGKVVLDAAGRGVIFDRVTGDVLHVPVPTAIENVILSKGRYVHGDTGSLLSAEPEVAAPEPVIELKQEDVLDLPAPEAAPVVEADPEPEAEPEPEVAAEPEAPAELTPAQVEALDRDGDGKAGGSKPRKAGGFAARASK